MALSEPAPSCIERRSATRSAHLTLSAPSPKTVELNNYTVHLETTSSLPHQLGIK